MYVCPMNFNFINTFRKLWLNFFFIQVYKAIAKMYELIDFF